VTLVVVLLILAALWIVVLLPGYLKKRQERRSTGSIESFHERLHLLERTGPKLVEPAYRLETANPQATPASSGLPTVSSNPGRAKLVLLQPVSGDAFDAEDDVVDDREGTHYRRVAPLEFDTPPLPPLPGPERRGPDPYRRQLAAKRRRDTLAVLVGIFLVTAAAGSLHPLHPLWVLTAISGLALVAYVGLLVYAQSLNAEQRRLEQLRRNALGPVVDRWPDEDDGYYEHAEPQAVAR
jgi:hypothetical protein